MDQYNASRKIPRWDDYSVVLDARLANTPRWHLGRIDMGVPQEIIKSVVFLGKRRDDNTLYLGGTAFFVIVPGERTNFLYLVAARHSIIELCGMSIEIRLNTTDGKFREIPIGSDDKWKFHPTEEKSVDVAVMPFEFDDSMDIKPIPKSMFLTDSGIDEYYLGQGDEVTITGLFTLLSGDQKNIPIVRRGSVAMLPEDKIRKVNMGGGKSADIEGYLIEVRSVGGLSGSPIFVQSPIGYNMNVHGRSGERRDIRAQLLGDYSLLGLAHGHWEIPPEAKGKVVFPTAKKGEDSINLGIAIVVPAKKILEVLDHPELAAKRKQREDELYEAMGTSTPDCVDPGATTAKPPKSRAKRRRKPTDK